MQDLTPSEINQLLVKCDWGTLMAVDGDKPYGVEVSHFIDEEAVYLIINPAGKIAGCISRNPNVAYKVCKADLPTQRWSAATLEGKIERLKEPRKIYECFLKLAKRLNRDTEKYEKLGKQFSENPDRSPVYFIPIKNISGKASHNGFYTG